MTLYNKSYNNIELILEPDRCEQICCKSSSSCRDMLSMYDAEMDKKSLI